MKKQSTSENDYKYIRAYGRMLRSFPYYIDLEVDRARRDRAPETAISQRQDGTWMTFEDIKSDDVKAEILAILKKMGY